LNRDTNDKINQLLNSETLNYLETSERLILKNILQKEDVLEIDIENLDKIFTKYGKFLKN
jgi:hypothetical protein